MQIQKFRSAVFLRDKATAKVFFNFPIKNENNEIWYLAYEQNEKAIEKLPSTIKPFTSADFDKYFDEIFPKYFVKSLQKIKTDELFKKGTFETNELKDSTSTYKLYAALIRIKILWS